MTLTYLGKEHCLPSETLTWAFADRLTDPAIEWLEGLGLHPKRSLLTDAIDAAASTYLSELIEDELMEAPPLGI